MTANRRRPEPLMRFGASSFHPDDPLTSLWATVGAYRLIALLYALYIHTSAVASYHHPHVASAVVALQCMWTGLVAYGMYA